MLAVMNAAIEVVRALLEAGASVHTENDQKETALRCLPRNEAARRECFRLLITYGADVNQRDKSGTSLVLNAARSGDLDVVEFCLSKGADIDERELDPFQPSYDSNIFHFLAYGDFRDETDRSVARLLEKYVFTCPDMEKTRRVVEVRDRDGETLLHRFALMRMPHCVETLVRHGAPINALQKKHKREREGDAVFKTSWHQTPLDVIIAAMESRKKEMRTDKEYSKHEYEVFRHMDEAIVTTLQRAGGVLASKEVVRKPFVFDESRYGAHGGTRAFREC